MIDKRRMTSVAVGCLLLLGGCGIMPASGPTISELKDRAEKNPLNFKMVELTPEVADATGGELAGAPLPATLPGPIPPDRIGIGDILQVSIYESGAGLFAHADTGATATALPPLPVGRDGTVTIPYVGRLEAAGLSPAELQGRLVTALEQKASQPQVLITVTGNINNTVVVSGDIHTPGRYPLTAASEHLLDAIAAAGGSNHPSTDTVVQLTRGQSRARFGLGSLDALSPVNFVVAPGDEIELIYQPQTLTIFGASGRVGVIPLPSSHVTLAQGIALGAGPSDDQADPAGVYLFRFETVEGAHKLGFADATEPVPVIYHLDLLDPTSYFLLQKWTLRDKDMLYVANSEGMRLKKFLGLLQALFSPVSVATPARSLSN